MELIFENIQKSFEGRTVLDLPRLTVREGMVTGILGANGSGKSTLLHLAAGLTAPDRGRILYDGSRQFPNEKVTLGFQKPYLLNTTVEKNIAYPLRLRGWDDDRLKERVDRLMEELSLGDHRKKKPWKLSGGEIQKVALARALSFHPELLMLDEPTANIDPMSLLDIEHMLRKVNGQGMTILLVSHNLAQARRLCDWIVFLDKGKLIEEQDAGNFFRHPKEESTRWFISHEIVPGPDPGTPETPTEKL